MAGRYVWKSPNGIWTITNVTKFPRGSSIYRDGYIGMVGIKKDVWAMEFGVLIDMQGNPVTKKKTEFPDYVLDKAKSLMRAKVAVSKTRTSKYKSGTREKYGGRYFTFIDNGREYDMYVIGLDPDFPDAGRRTPYYIPRNRINDKAYRRKQAMNFLADLKKPRVKFNGIVF